ncbi:MAG: LysR family transcriptional regulator [Rhizobiaceae bacterium]
MTMDIGQLNYVIAAAENESFRRAACALRVQQSSVSRAICRLEDELGVSLFERRSTGARLTNAGRRLLCEVRPALEQLEMARKTAAAAGRADIGTVRVGILTSLVGGFLHDLVHSYTQRHPRVRLDIREGSREEHVGALQQRRLDIAFLSGTAPVPDCETAPLWRERVHIALPRQHRLAGCEWLDWSDVRRERFVITRTAPGPEVHDYIIRRAADYSNYPKVTAIAVAQETLLNLVSLGQGVAIVLESRAAAKPPGLVFLPLIDPADIVPFSAVWSPRNDNPALRRFISVAHTLAGCVRRGTSDWSPEALGLAPIKDGISANGQKLDPSP